MNNRLFTPLLFLLTLPLLAQPQFSQPHGLYDGGSLSVTITPGQAGAAIRYTTDGSEPTLASKLYTGALTIDRSTILRAVEVTNGEVSSSVSTVSYLFTASVLSQSNSPAGYPAEWGAYTQIYGTAIADYEMDPEMTGDATLRPKIIEGLKQLPILSVVSDKDNFFSHENDSVTGGIYIFTGPPVGDGTGHGWTRPASVELFGGPQQHDLSTTCGIRLHGGHGRLAEKNPKHSLRLVFKEQYGAKNLKYPLFEAGDTAKFKQLVLRCHFGNSWQHWSESNRQKAQYTRDVWARRMQRKMGHTSVDALYVHLFLNGMYWGLYNIAERVDDQYGSDHLGGKKSAIDVIKIEEDGGNHIEASEGDLEAWQLMTATAAHASQQEYYEQLDTLLDIDNFIDYMIINQYGGNTDWDHHNWYAIRRRGTDSQGFRFLCWDSELILDNPRENVLNTNNGIESPTGIFHSLLGNADFARRYVRRAKELLADDGFLGPQSATAVWDSLYHTIDKALYCEAARWGDYCRDVHRWQSAGDLYTVDNHYQAERSRLAANYFPVRSTTALNQILDYVNIDDFEVPDGWVTLASSMFHEWDGTGADAQPNGRNVNVDWNMGTTVGGGTAVAGFANVEYNRFADISDYEKLVIRGSGSQLRVLANRLEDHGEYKEVVVSFNSSDPYWDSDLEAIVLPLDVLKTAKTSKGNTRNDDFVHLHVLKVNWNNSVKVLGAYLVPPAENTDVSEELRVKSEEFAAATGWYTLDGRKLVGKPTAKGLYIHRGRAVVIK